MSTILLCLNLTAQKLQFFSKVPRELGGDNYAGELEKIVSDSQNIYVMGHLPKSIQGNANYSFPIIATYKYDGEVKRYGLVIDSNILNYPFGNQPLIKKNDSIYFSLFYINNPNSIDYASSGLYELNLRNGDILNKKFFYDRTKNLRIQVTAISEIRNNAFQIIVRNVNPLPDPIINYIYEFDTMLNITNTMKIPYAPARHIVIRWVSKDKQNNYELIAETRIDKNNKATGESFLSYIKIDSLGQLIKKKDLPISGNFYIDFAETYTIIQEKNGNFVIACNEYDYDLSTPDAAPYIIKVSPEFDSLIWKTKFYEYAQLQGSPYYFLNYLTRMKDASGYVACGDIYTLSESEPDYGILYKAGFNGDSLWLRKYYPLGWDTLRASQMSFKQVTCTPYNTLAIAAYVGDNNSGYIHPWILHLDEDGCLVPGCGKYVNSEDIANGKIKPFDIFPNPIISNKIYLLSRIHSIDPLVMKLLNLQGEIILQNKIKVDEGIQYIIDMPTELVPSTYILQIMDAHGKVLLSDKIVKE